MDSKFAQRCLPLLLALVMVLSLTPNPALALEAEDTVPAEPEELPTESSAEVEISVTIEDIQNRINTLLDFFGITAEMTDNEIANAIIEADSDTVNTTKVAIDAIESDAQNFTENEIMCLDTILYGRFCAVFDRLFAPAPIASVTVLDGLLSITDSKSRISVSGGTVTATAKGSTIYRSQNDLTFTNESGSKATLTFDYSISGYDSHSFPEDSGTYTAILDAGASVTQYIIAPRFNKTVTLTMNNFSLVAVAATSEVTFEFDSSKGSVTVDGTAITSGDKRSLSADTGAILVATPKSTDYTFLGWINKATGKIQDTPDGKFIATESMTLKAVFVAKASDTGWFLTSGTHLFDNLTNANNHAKNASNKTIVLANNGTLSGSHEISSGVTLLIPFDSANTLYTTAPATVDEYIKPTAYRTLTMADGAVITVKNGGAVSVSGKHSAKMNSYNGSPSGPQGFIVMNEGSNITVEGNGTLYAWGYIVGEARSSNDTVPTGGTVTIESSGKVYECFQVTDYRGGSATSDMASAWGSNVRTYHVFPMSQYYVQNVQVPMTLHSNATETGYFSVNATGVGLRSVSVPFIGSTGMFRINSGYIVKDYDEQSDRLLIDIHGNLEMASIQLSIPGALGISIDIDSNDYVLPLTNNMTATLHTGYTLAITQDLAILPGAVLDIKENATVTVGTSSSKKSIYVYDTAQWGDYCGEYDKTVIPLTYAYDRFVTRSADSLTDAAVFVNGTIDATNGYAYTTKDGANIYSTGAGKIIAGAAGTNTVTYQVTQGDDSSSTSIYFKDISITPAKLKNEDGTYLQSASNTYNYAHHTCEHEVDSHGVWYAGKHELSSEETPPTCITEGYTTYTCTCGHSYTANKTDFADHTPADAVQENVKKATCLEPGSYDSVIYCSVSNCGEELSRTSISVPAAGHTYVDGKCSVCGCVEVSFTIAHNLALKDLVQIGYWVKAETTSSTITEYGILIWDEFSYFSETDHTINSATAVKPTLTSRQGFMMGYGEGILAQHLDTRYYAVPYVKLEDGAYVYSGTPDVYAAPFYATQMSGQSDKVKAVVRDLLNYGTYAKYYFATRDGEDISQLPQINEVLSENDRVLTYDASMKVVWKPLESNKNDFGFTNDTVGDLTCTWFYTTVVLEEAIQLNYFAAQNENFSNMLYWNESAYYSADTLTKDNATNMLTVSLRTMGSDLTSTAQISEIYAKDIFDWQFACMYSESASYSSLYIDSVAAYVSRQLDAYAKHENETAENGYLTEEAYLVETCKAMLAYGTSAKAYAGS